MHKVSFQQLAQGFLTEKRGLSRTCFFPKIALAIPIGSMYGIFAYIYHKNQPNVGKYTIHGSYGIGVLTSSIGVRA